MKCDILIVGGGTGGVAAALALLDKGLSVVLTEETDWLGGQFTSQLVPPDEHPWIEGFGCTRRYRWLRNAIRAHYRLNKPPESLLWDEPFNPGGGWVSRLCHKPFITAGLLAEALEAASGLTIHLQTVPIAAACHDGRVTAVQLRSLDNGKELWIEPAFVLDATELGDLLPMTGTAYVKGAECRSETGEPHAPEGPPQPDNIQAFTWCAAVGYDPVGDHTINKPDKYGFWRSYVPPHWTGHLLDLTFPNVRNGAPMTLPMFGPGLTLFGYRQIVDTSFLDQDEEAATVMNWPQNDYMLGEVVDVEPHTAASRLEEARQLTLSALYWLQTELGLKGLRLRPDLTGTSDGLAKAPYHREGRRIRSLRTVKEQDVVPACNPDYAVAPPMWDTVGVGAYRIDLHPSSNGAKTIDISALPFQIPLGALVPTTTSNLIPACKNIGTTHITNGCFRLHPVEWNIGEVAGLLAAYCLSHSTDPKGLYTQPTEVADFQGLLADEGVELAWPQLGAL